MEELKASIAGLGLLNRIIVRPLEHGVCLLLHTKNVDFKENIGCSKVKSLKNIRYGPDDRIRTCGLLVPKAFEPGVTCA